MVKQPHPLLDLDAAVFSQSDLCEVAGISMATANNWILAGALCPAKVGTRRARKPRLFSVNTIFQARLIAKLVQSFGLPPSTGASTAAAIARATTREGHNWTDSVKRTVDRSRAARSAETKYLDLYAVVFWSEECGDWEAMIEIPSPGGLKIDFPIIADREPRFAERPLIVIQVSNDYASVYAACVDMLEASQGTTDGSE